MMYYISYIDQVVRVIKYIIHRSIRIVIKLKKNALRSREGCCKLSVDDDRVHIYTLIIYAL